MRAWQETNNHEVTGVLTTGQQAELLNDYNSILDGMGLHLVRDDAIVVHQDDALGLAVLRLTDHLAPPAVAEFQTGVPRLNAEIAVAGFPYGGILTTSALTFGKLADIRGLNGQALPPEVSFSVDADQIVVSLTGAGLTVATTGSITYMTPEALTLMAADMAVLVSCWDD